MSKKLVATEMDYWRTTRIPKHKRGRNKESRKRNERFKKISNRWYCHIKRMEYERMTKEIVGWEAEGKRRMGRPEEKWIEDVRESHHDCGLEEREFQLEFEEKSTLEMPHCSFSFFPPQNIVLQEKLYY